MPKPAWFKLPIINSQFSLNFQKLNISIIGKLGHLLKIGNWKLKIRPYLLPAIHTSYFILHHSKKTKPYLPKKKIIASALLLNFLVYILLPILNETLEVFKDTGAFRTIANYHAIKDSKSSLYRWETTNQDLSAYFGDREEQFKNTHRFAIEKNNSKLDLRLTPSEFDCPPNATDCSSSQRDQGKVDSTGVYDLSATTTKTQNLKKQIEELQKVLGETRSTSSGQATKAEEIVRTASLIKGGGSQGSDQVTFAESNLINGAFQDTQINYEIVSRGVKQTILLPNKDSASEREFLLTVQNLKVIKTGENSFVLTNPDQTTVIQIGRAIMKDAKGVTADPSQVVIDIVQETRGIILSVETNKDWLSQVDRKFPVTIENLFAISDTKDPKVKAASTLLANAQNSKVETLTINPGQTSDYLYEVLNNNFQAGFGSKDEKGSSSKLAFTTETECQNYQETNPKIQTSTNNPITNNQMTDSTCFAGIEMKLIDESPAAKVQKNTILENEQTLQEDIAYLSGVGVIENSNNDMSLVDKVEAKEIRSGVDIEYKVFPSGVKEDIIVKHRPEGEEELQSKSTYTYAMNAVGVTPKLENGIWNFYAQETRGHSSSAGKSPDTNNDQSPITNNQKDSLFHFPSPYAEDASGIRTDATLNIEPFNECGQYLEETSSKSQDTNNDPISKLDTNNTITNNQITEKCYRVTVTVDPTWLSDESRIYPVAIDPSIVDDTTTEFAITNNSAQSAAMNRVKDIDSYTFATWNPSDKGANITLSNSNLTASNSTNSTTYHGVRSTIGVSSGKWYWEYTITNVSSNANYVTVGFASASQTLTPNTSLSDMEGYRVYHAGLGTKYASGGTSAACGASYTTNDKIGVKMDMDAGSVEVLKNNASQCTLATGLSGTYYAYLALFSNGSTTPQVTANFGASTFNYGVPSGYNSGLYTLPDTSAAILENYYQELPVDINTVGLWHMNEGIVNTCSGGTNDVCDATSNANNGAFNGNAAHTTSSILGASATTYDGTGDYTEITDAAILEPSYVTVEAWVNPASTSNSGVVNKGSSAAGDGRNGYLISVNSGANFCIVISDAQTCTASAALNTSTWYHLAGTYDGAHIRIYVNGVEANRAALTGTLDYTGGGQNLIIGAAYSLGVTAGFNGKIDEVRISNIVRSPEEIRLNAQRRPYATFTSNVFDFTANAAGLQSLTWTENGVSTGNGETLSSTTNRIAQWNFNETSGTTADNAEGTAARDGTLTGFGSCTDSQEDTTAGCELSGWTATNRRWGDGAIKLDGGTDWVDVGQNTLGSAVNGSSAYSITTWVKPAKISATRQRIINWHIDGDGSSGASLAIMNTHNGSVEFRSRSQTADSLSNTTLAVPELIGQWLYIVIVVDVANDNVKTYINGMLKNTETATFGASTYTQGTVTTGARDAIGGYDVSSSTTEFFQGTIDSTAVFTRALTANEILSNYNHTNIEFQTRTGADNTPNDGSWEAWKPTTGEAELGDRGDLDGPYQYSTTESGLVSYWPMDETSEKRAADVKDSTVTRATWNANDKNGSITLSNGNLTATDTSQGVVHRGVRATIPKSSGKWYWEVTINTKGRDVPIVGVANSSASLTTFTGGDANGWGYGADGNKYTGAAGVAYGSTYTTGDIISVALDMDIGAITFYKNGVSQGTAYASLSGPLFPMQSLITDGTNTTAQVTANFGATAFTHSVPSGYNSGLYSTGNEGAVKEATIVDGKFGKARGFDGSNDTVVISDNSNIDFSGDFSVEAWIKTTSSSTQYVVAKLLTNSSDLTYAFFIDTSGFINFRLYNTSNNTYLTVAGTTSLRDGQWHHVVGTVASTTITVYANGVSQASSTSTSGTRDTDSVANLYIGSSTVGDAPFNGVIDEVRIYNDDISTATIKEHYIEGMNQLGNLNVTNSTDTSLKVEGTASQKTVLGAPKVDSKTVGLWRLDETNSAGPIYDSTGYRTFATDTTGNLEQNLKHYWRFDETTDDTCADANSDACDGVGKVGIAAVNSPARVAGKLGNARDFVNGGTTYMSISVAQGGPTVRNLTKYSISGWFYLDTLPGSGAGVHIYSEAANTGSNVTRAMILVENSHTSYANVANSLTFAFRDTDGGTQRTVNTGASSITTGTWYNFVATYDADNDQQKLYLNGTAFSATFSVAAVSDTAANNLIGVGIRPDLTSATIPDGRIDEIGVWHGRVLSASEATDLYNSGNGNILTSLASNTGTPLTAPSVADGYYNKGRDFEQASSQYITVGDGVTDGLTNLTIEAWIKPETMQTQSIVAKDTEGVGGRSFQFRTTSTVIQIIMCGDTSCSSSTTVNGATTMVVGNWYHVAAVLTGSSSLVVYLNGTQDGSSGTSVASVPNSTASLEFGRTQNGTTYFDGIIDEVRISNVARSYEEIQEAYKAGRDHRIGKDLDPSSTIDLSSKSTLPFYVAADRPGTYLEATVGESAYANWEPDANTVGIWHLEETAGTGSYLKDSSGYGNHAQIGSGTRTVLGKYGMGRNFNTAEYLNVTDSASLDLTSQITMETWVRFTTINTGAAEGIISKGESGGTQTGYVLTLSPTDKIQFAPISPTGTSITSNTSVVTNTWYHLAATYDGSTAKLYINGVLDVSGAASGAITTNNQPFTIGRYYGNFTGNHLHGGDIDEVRLSNIARTADEIRQAFEVGKRTHPITIDFVSNPQAAYTSGTSMTINNMSGQTNLSDSLKVGDTIIVQENVGGIEYRSTGTVTVIANTSSVYGTVTLASALTGLPPSGYTTNAKVFKWQREYFDLSGITLRGTHDNAITRLTLRVTDGSQGANIWLDDIKSNTAYLSTASGSTVTSTAQRYYQYRAIFTSADPAVSANLTAVTQNYVTGPTLSQIMRHGAWFSSGVSQPFWWAR